MDAHKRVRRARLAVEALESKELMAFNALAALEALPALLISPLQQSESHHLTGVVTGHYKTSFAVPDVGQTVTLTGSGRLSPLGRVMVTGNLHSVGFIQTGQATGTLVLSTPRGTLTLALTGPSQAGFSPLPADFQYKSVSGTGAFKNTNVSGHVGFLSFATGSASGGSGAGMFNQGRFVLSFD